MRERRRAEFETPFGVPNENQTELSSFKLFDESNYPYPVCRLNEFLEVYECQFCFNEVNIIIWADSNTAMPLDSFIF